MKNIGELLQEVLPTLSVEHNPHSNTLDYIRKEKACLIEDIFRVMRASCAMNSIYIDLIGKNAVQSFDEIYEMSIHDLELLLAHLSAELKTWMRECQRLSMTSKFVPNYQYRRNIFRSNPEDDLN